LHCNGFRPERRSSSHREPTTVSRPSLRPRRNVARLWRRDHSTAEKLHTRAGPSPSKRPRGALSLAASKSIPRSVIPKDAYPNRSGEVRPVGQIGGATYSVSCRLKPRLSPSRTRAGSDTSPFVAQCDVQAHLASKGGHSGGLFALSEKSGATAAWNLRSRVSIPVVQWRWHQRSDLCGSRLRGASSDSPASRRTSSTASPPQFSAAVT